MTRVVKIGNLKLGGGNPVAIKGMLKTPFSQVKKLVSEAKTLEREGAQALRIAVKEEGDVGLVKIIKKHISLPMVADVHFHHRLALCAIEAGFDAVRLNPMNISKRNEVKEVARLAKRYKVSIRVGINSGGFRRDFSSPQALALQMIKETESYLKILESVGFFDIMVSLKGADVMSTVAANELFAEKFDYPLHLGITATGPFLNGVVKSSIGLGNLLSRGIGDVIRVSLTAPSFWEIRVAKNILQALKLGKFKPEIISCPTCSRCQVDLIKIVDKVEKELDMQNINKSLKVAVMGCVVNGPGEACQADIGAAFGDKKAAIFKKGKILGWAAEDKVVEALIKEIKNNVNRV